MEALCSDKMEVQFHDEHEFEIPNKWCKRNNLKKIQHVPGSVGTLLIGEDQKFLHPIELSRHNNLSISRSKLTGDILLSGSDGRNTGRKNYVQSNRTIIRNIIDQNSLRSSDSLSSTDMRLVCGDQSSKHQDQDSQKLVYETSQQHIQTNIDRKH